MGRHDPRHHQRVGLIYGLAAYAWWGFIPLYFKLVAHVPPFTVLAHRVAWSAIFLAAILCVQQRWREVASAMRQCRTLALLGAGSVLIAINWYVFIYAVATDQVMQASLGYYINPLVCVLLGMAVLGERMRALQWSAVALALIGVIVMASGDGARLPWIALTLAISFGLYALTRKFVHIGPMIALLVETTLLVPVALGYLLVTPDHGSHELGVGTYGLLALAGVITALPLLWFANAARCLRLSTMGFLQYLAPSLQFVCAVVIFDERFDGRRLGSFAIIWAALAVFTLDAVRAHRAPPLAADTPLAD